MTQNTHVVLTPITYTRADYTALRAHVLKIPLARIADLYYSEDSPQLAHGLERYLIDMRNDLIERAIVNNPAFADILKGARQGGAVTTKALDILVKAADVPVAQPQLHQPVAQWFRPKTAAVLRDEGIVQLSDLLAFIKRRGPGWWRSIPRIGAKRADVIASWLRQHSKSLGELSIQRFSVEVPAIAVVLDPLHADQLAPLGRFAVPSKYDGSAGINRSSKFCFIQADNDLRAVEFYLARFEDKAHTFRAYRKELERFLLWAIMVRQKPMSSLLVDDCEAYKLFLQAPSPAFVGDKAARFTDRWRPFTKTPMTAKSQKQAIIILRAAFDYFVRVRYLGGNPWSAVIDPKVTEEVHDIQIERALSEEFWQLVVTQLEQRASVPENSQDRAALAAILLLGDSGLRREEAAGSRRSALKPSPWAASVSTLRVVGKRNKKRDVPVSARTLDALRAHWTDRHLDFDAPPIAAGNVLACNDVPLIGPLVVPRHLAAIERHEKQTGNGYTADGLYKLIKSALKRLEHALLEHGISPRDFAQLETTSPHAFRHTFGTLSVAEGMPLDVAQSILGHVSAATTSIYVRAKDKRIAEEAAKYFKQQSEKNHGS